MDHIIREMKQLGLTEYEVKAYLTLLKNYPISGYALSKHSGIPRSRIYEVLEGLKKKQIVFEAKAAKASVYTPLEPSLLMKNLRKSFEATIESVGAYTTSLYEIGATDLEPKILRGREAIIRMIQVLIREAKSRVALSIWDEELLLIKEDLDAAKAGDVLLRGVYFGTDNPFDEMVNHRRIERYAAEKDERYIIVVIDDRHCISGIISRGKDSQATWSRDPGIIDISDDYIAHDVMLNTYSRLLEGRDRERYEHELDEVRKDYYGFSDEEFGLFPLPEATKKS